MRINKNNGIKKMFLDTLGLAPAFNGTTYQTRKALVAMAVDQQIVRFDSDVELIDFDKVVRMGCGQDTSVVGNTDIAVTFRKHNIYLTGQMPLLRTAMHLIQLVGLSFDETTVMEYFKTLGFSEPTTILPTTQIMNMVGITTGKIKTKKTRTNRSNGKVKGFTVIKVLPSRRKILTWLSKLSIENAKTPKMVISTPLFAVNTTVEKANELAEADYYGTIERAFIGRYLVTLGTSTRRPRASFNHSAPTVYDLDQPFTKKFVLTQAKAGIALASDFGVQNVIKLTAIATSKTDGLNRIVWAMIKAIAKVNKATSKAAARVYEITSGEYNIEVFVEVKDLIGRVYDKIRNEPVPELVLAGPAVVKNENYGLPASNWMPNISTTH